MKIILKPLDQQVMVITGASSGIGLATAQMAAQKGVKLVLAARSSAALQQIATEINEKGGTAIAVTCDVTDRKQIEQVAEQAVAKFGRIDTWVNNAGVSVYGRLDEVTEDDSRRLFDTNFWGLCNGSLIALPYLKVQGGALINVGSEVSEAVVPIQGMYCASKHAVKGFTDALRIEIQEVDETPISITLIQPTAVDTPYPQHAKNYQAQEAKLPSPMIKASQVAEAILDAAVRPTAAKKVGLMAKVNTTIAKIAPGIGDKMAAKQVDRQHYEESPRHPEGALYRASETTGVVGQTHGTGGLE